MTKIELPEQDAEAFVRMLLWDEFPECCGCPVEDYGGEYMGQREVVLSCCGNPEPAPLSDAQIVASLRERFPNHLNAAIPAAAGDASGGVNAASSPPVGNEGEGGGEGVLARPARLDEAALRQWLVDVQENAANSFKVRNAAALLLEEAAPAGVVEVPRG